ncbi:MAG: 50S ribosomal protein L11 methyltransferase [Paludibacteraceae bacterium]|nr:50S ribosomal protein L11 methyltransferase [Paludibacteraceae bacterium]MEE3484008.1 50S ribosomal protein L11 methyltransferase [Bacteroidales bacterium]
MKYLEITFDIPSKEIYIKDILSAELADLGFESFSDEADPFIGYIPQNSFDETKLADLLANFEYEKGISYSLKQAEDKDWNEEWEKNFFQPIVIGDKCVIHSTFHKDYPKVQYDIVIDPKMAFGTGHHATTSLMAKAILDIDVKNKSLLDMGCGTAILAILAALRGASPITGIDIDEWAYNNAIENIQLNHTEQITLKKGGAELLGDEKFDIILANINRNILLNDIKKYVKVLNSNGLLILSGFYESDIDAIEKECNQYGLEKLSYEKNNNWVAVRFIKK